jgi:hypothetical protein
LIPVSEILGFACNDAVLGATFLGKGHSELIQEGRELNPPKSLTAVTPNVQHVFDP